MWIREMSKYLAGGCVVYAVVAACSSVPSGSSDGGNLLDAMARPIPQADAQGAECGQCVLPTPMKVMTADTDPAQDASGTIVVDPENSYPMTRPLADGGFVLTGLFLWGGAKARLYSVRSEDSCLADASADVDEGSLRDLNRVAGHWRLLWGHVSTEPPLQLSGVRILIPAEEKLCFASFQGSERGTLVWSGYRPYEG